MEVFDTTIVKRENLDDFSNDNTYLDQFMVSIALIQAMQF